MKFLIFLTALAFLCIVGESLVVDCKFYIVHDWGYKCDVQNSELIASKDDREILKARGQHESEKTNDDVKYFRSDMKIVFFFPILTKVFKNIETIAIDYARDLKNITREDLKQFEGKLKRLSFYGCSIEVLQADLFEDNQNLERLDLGNNKIRHIEDGALTKLQNLKIFYFDGNPCEMFDTNQETEQKCKDPNYIPITTLKGL